MKACPNCGGVRIVVYCIDIEADEYQARCMDCGVSGPKAPTQGAAYIAWEALPRRGEAEKPEENHLIRYTVVTGSGVTNLCNFVNGSIREGWRPFGGVGQVNVNDGDSPVLAQAMVKVGAS